MRQFILKNSFEIRFILSTVFIIGIVILTIIKYLTFFEGAALLLLETIAFDLYALKESKTIYIHLKEQ